MTDCVRQVPAVRQRNGKAEALTQVDLVSPSTRCPSLVLSEASTEPEGHLSRVSCDLGGGTAPVTSEPESHQVMDLPNQAPTSSQQTIRECDIVDSIYKTGLARIAMPVIALMRLGTFFIGTVLVFSGYSICKLTEIFAGTGRAVDNRVYQVSFLSWLWGLGIIPRVRFDPIPEKLGQQLKEKYKLAAIPVPEDRRLSPIVVSNHSSYLDGIVLAPVFYAPRFVAMASSRKTPFLGKLMEEMGVLFVDRTSSNSRQATQDAIANHCATWNVGEKPVLIFAEGTTSNSKMVIPFKKGAFTSGHPVRPSLMVYTGRWDPASVTYRRTPSGVEKILDIEWAKQLWGHIMHPVSIRVLPPYLPSKEEQEDPGLYARNVRDLMQRELDAMRAELFEGKSGFLSYLWGLLRF